MDNKEFNFNWDESSDEDIFFSSFEKVLFNENDFMVDSPFMYEVTLLNDKLVSKNFVKFILQKVFHYSDGESDALIGNLLSEDVVLCGTYTKDSAETKILLVNEYANRYDTSVKCIMQRENQYAIKES